LDCYIDNDSIFIICLAVIFIVLMDDYIVDFRTRLIDREIVFHSSRLMRHTRLINFTEEQN